MTKNITNDMTVLGVYENLTYKDAHKVADDTLQAARYKGLLEDGYEVVGNVTRDTTPAEIDQIVHDTADKMTPPASHPIWTALAKRVYQDLTPRMRCQVILGGENLIAEFEAKLADHVAKGGDEDEFCLAYLDELTKDWGEDKWEKGANGREL